MGVRLLRWLEWVACRLPDRLIIDTEDYAAWFQTTYSIPAERFGLVPTGADDHLYQPVSVPSRNDGRFVVVFYGTFIPNHGVLFIVEAARLLIDGPSVRFQLIGDGPERPVAQALAEAYGLKNVTFHDWLEPEALAQQVALADVRLGAFGLTPQSMMTVQNKIYEGLAMAKPVLTGDSPAVRRVLKHDEHLYLCERANPAALAEAVRFLYQNTELRLTIAPNGYGYYCKKFTLVAIGLQFKQHVYAMARDCFGQRLVLRG